MRFTILLLVLFCFILSTCTHVHVYEDKVISYNIFSPTDSKSNKKNIFSNEYKHLKIYDKSNKMLDGKRFLINETNIHFTYSFIRIFENWNTENTEFYYFSFSTYLDQQSVLQVSLI